MSLFLDYDIELDLIRAELGEKPTPAVKLLDMWNNVDIWNNKPERSQVFYKIGLSRKDLLLLASDWMRHVLPIYEEFYKFSHDRRQREALSAIADYLNGKINILILHESRSKVKEAYDQSWEKWEVPAAILDIVYEVTFHARQIALSTVARAAEVDVDVDLLLDTSARAASVAAYNVSPHSWTPEWLAANQQERKWQTRRFVDIFSRLQAGKRWPKLKVTK